MLLGQKAAKVRTLVLTFDDGPGDRLTPAILDVLVKNNAKATFFLLGRNITGREQIVRQIAAQGHEICSHGYDHLHHWKVSPVRALIDIKRGWQAIDKALGSNQGVYPFRPPYGRLNLPCLLYLLIAKAPIIYWTVVSGDTYPREKRDSKKGALEARKAGGAVLLAHDNDRINPDTESMVLESVRSALAMADEAGMKLVTISQLLDARRLI